MFVDLIYCDTISLVIKMTSKNILIIFTGGTISMEKDANSQAVNIRDNHDSLIQTLENQFKNIKLSSITFSMVPSPFMKIDDLFTLAKLTFSKLKNEIDGIVITHGTDTLEETAYFLDIFDSSSKPIVLTGSMRNYSEIGYDGLSNLASSILVAASDDSKNHGVLVVLNDEINAASEVTKSHTLSLDTFKSLEFGPIGIIDNQNVIYYRRIAQTKKVPQISNLKGEVEIVKVSLGQSSLLLNLLIDHKISGIVLEALGRGNVPPQLVPSIERALKENIPVVLTSRAPKGRVLDTYGYVGGGRHLKNLGVIFAPNINSQKARLKLLLLKSHTDDLDVIRRYF